MLIHSFNYFIQVRSAAVTAGGVTALNFKPISLYEIFIFLIKCQPSK